MSRFELVRCDSPEALASAAAARWIERVRAAAQHRRRQTVALSGGRIARTFFDATARLVRDAAVPFDHLEFFWADDRCVPASDAESNYRLAREHLLDPLGICPARVHPPCGDDGRCSPGLASAELANVATSTTATGVPVIDLVFLGMGEDGHVASLFPGEDAATRSLPDHYRIVTAPKPPPRRVTLGYHVLAAAGEVWVLVSGAGKEAALGESLRADGSTPLTRVLESRPHTVIFSDLEP